MLRLYEAARVMSDATYPAAVARLLNVPQQMLKNWDTRGISQKGANHAQAVIGCNAVWLLTGEGEMSIKPLAKDPAGKLQASAKGTWPFESITQKRFDAMSDKYKGIAEGAVRQILEEWEAKKAKAK